MVRRTIRAAVAGVVAALALAGCAQSEENAQNAVASGGTFEFISPGGQTTIRYAEEDRKPLKDFSGEDLRDESTTIKLSDFKDQIVVLNSWGQWCAPCRLSLIHISEPTRHFKRSRMPSSA